MSSPSLTSAIHLAQSLNAAQRASSAVELQLATLKSQVRWLSALILVLLGLPDGAEVAAAVILFSCYLMRDRVTPSLFPERKRVLDLDDLDAALSQAVARGESEESEAR